MTALMHHETALALLALGFAFAGVVVSALCVMQHRARQRSEASLARALRAERRFSEAFESSPVAQMLTRLEDQKIVEVNATCLELLGWSREDVIGKTASELGMFAPAACDRMLRRLYRRGWLRDQREVLHGNGAARDVVMTIGSTTIDGEPFMLTALVDETQRLRTEAALRSSDQTLRDLAMSIDDVFFLSTPSRDRMIYISPAYAKIFGRSPQALYENPQLWLDTVHPDDRAMLLAAHEGEAPSRMEHEYRIVRPDGTLRWVLSQIFAVRDANGSLVRLAGVISDITERRSLEEQVRQAQKMESLGMLAGGVAHDFNNLLAVIASCSGLLGETLAVDSPDKELVDEIDHAVERATGLTRQLLAFSRKQVSEPVVVDVNALVHDTQKMLSRVVGEDIAVDVSLDPELAHVRIDSGNLVQVLMNLAVNARDAMTRGGRLVISTRNIDAHGGTICLAVTDTGIGMSADVRRRVFEPFFTTKDRGKGTGMGLAVVHGIVDQAGGRIEVDSTPGVGTTFRVYFPAVDAKVASARDQVLADSRGHETILIVDDDEYVRRSTARALRAHGYTVVEARDGYLAVGELVSRPFDLLLSDVVMPGMDGRELAETARTHRPGMRVLFMSGYADDEIVRRGVQRGEAHLIEKPFRVPALVAKVRSVLDAPTREETAKLVINLAALAN